MEHFVCCTFRLFCDCFADVFNAVNIVCGRKCRVLKYRLLRVSSAAMRAESFMSRAAVDSNTSVWLVNEEKNAIITVCLH